MPEPHAPRAAYTMTATSAATTVTAANATMAVRPVQEGGSSVVCSLSAASR